MVVLNIIYIGIKYYKNGEIYEGEWKDGKRNGQGICI